MINNKTKIGLTLGIASLAVLLALGMSAAQGSSDLTVQRTKMRDIAISWNSADGLSASCKVYQRIMFWQTYEYAMEFNLGSGDTFNINMDILKPIYRDMKFVCVSGDTTMTVNSVFAMGALIINQIQSGCPVCSSCTECPICPICPTCPTHSNGQYCNENSECSSGFCSSGSHKCTNPPTTTTTLPPTTTTTIVPVCEPNGHNCEHDHDCCSDNCKWNQGHFHFECHN